MGISELTAISPVDGRYRCNVEELSTYFSEYSLMKYRVMIEIEYFIALYNIPLPQLTSLETSDLKRLREIYLDFTPEDAREIKEIEKKTNHDVKAVECYLKQKLDAVGLKKYREFIHFGLTSQDINNTAVPYSLKESMQTVIYPLMEELVARLKSRAGEWADVSMLAHTHGQPASPTRMGKEIMVFVDRLNVQIGQLKQIPYSAKFGGATGNFNAHHAAYPDINWPGFADHFVNEILGLQRSRITTQIEHYDNLAAIFHCLERINTILIDLSRDIWLYVSMDYFKQKIIKGEVGSSTMPHKVNPIDFENAEGNLGLANAYYAYMAAKLPVSRLQRDLTDSTVLRNLGVPLAHSVLAYKSLLKGLNKLIINPSVISSDLNQNWAVLSEAIQTILRREGYPEPYEMLKELTRTNKNISMEILHGFIDTLNIDTKVKEELKRITPDNYTGI
jgi:adenylosuccinate lyase